ATGEVDDADAAGTERADAHRGSGGHATGLVIRAPGAVDRDVDGARVDVEGAGLEVVGAGRAVADVHQGQGIVGAAGLSEDARAAAPTDVFLPGDAEASAREVDGAGRAGIVAHEQGSADRVGAAALVEDSGAEVRDDLAAGDVEGGGVAQVVGAARTGGV